MEGLGVGVSVAEGVWLGVSVGDGVAVSEVALADRDFAGLHFTGSTATFHRLWRTIAANLDSLPNRVMEVINPAASPIPGIGMPGNGTSTALPPGTPGSSGGLLPPPGGGGGGGTLPPGPPIPPPPVISAVPEPATWIMMIAGVGMIGWQLRRRRAIGTQAA